MRGVIQILSQYDFVLYILMHSRFTYLHSADVIGVETLDEAGVSESRRSALCTIFRKLNCPSNASMAS